MIKWILFGLSLTLLVSKAFGQRRAVKYCEVSLTDTRKLRGLTIDSGFVSPASLPDTAFNREIATVRNFNSIAELLNLMQRHGWTLIEVVTMGNPEWRKYYYFKKEL